MAKPSTSLHRSLRVVAGLVGLCAVVALPERAQSATRDPQVPPKQLISPEELRRLLASQKPLLLYVGFRSMYQQAHIPGSEYAGATNSPEGLDALRAHVKSQPKDKLIVIYCGCCPWERCPNIRRAYRELRELGYTNIRVLYIANNFGADWVDKSYPTVKGE